MARETRPAPPPLEGNDQVIIAVGTAAWLIALIVLLLVRNHLGGATWWIWAAAVGIGLGIFAHFYVPRLKRGRARAAERHASHAAAGPADGSSSVPHNRSYTPAHDRSSSTPPRDRSPR